MGLTFVILLIADVGDMRFTPTLPWFTSQPLVSGGVFSDYLVTTSSSSVLVMNGKQHSVQCDYRELEHPTSIVYTRLSMS